TKGFVQLISAEAARLLPSPMRFAKIYSNRLDEYLQSPRLASYMLRQWNNLCFLCGGFQQRNGGSFPEAVRRTRIQRQCFTYPLQSLLVRMPGYNHVKVSALFQGLGYRRIRPVIERNAEVVKFKIAESPQQLSSYLLKLAH